MTSGVQSVSTGVTQEGAYFIFTIAAGHLGGSVDSLGTEPCLLTARA